MPNIEVRGYSERGMINAFCYEIMYSNNSIKLLRDFLKLCIFPFSKPDFESVQKGKILIEQSFSDFGDLDLLILLEGEQKQAIFLEAKVKTYQANSRLISSEWSKFKHLPESKDSSSSLFIQLYRKMRLVRKLQNMDRDIEGDILASRWSLGDNAIVKKAAQELSPYSSNSWFIALIPDSEENVEQFVKNELPLVPEGLADWDSSHFGYLTWEKFERHCKQYPDEWQQTIANFNYNEGQIFGTRQGTSINVHTAPPSQNFALWNSPQGQQIVKVERRDTYHTRILLLDGTENVVDNNRLKEIPHNFPDLARILQEFQRLLGKRLPPFKPRTKATWKRTYGESQIVTIKNRNKHNTRVILPNGTEIVVDNNELFPVGHNVNQS